MKSNSYFVADLPAFPKKGNKKINKRVKNYYNEGKIIINTRLY